MSTKMPGFSFNFSLAEGLADDNEAFKFDLFLMTREMSQVNDSLKHITLLPRDKKKAWVRENQQLLYGFMDQLNHEMLNVLEDMSLDQDVMQNTVVCIMQLRELISTLNALMKEAPQLTS